MGKSVFDSLTSPITAPLNAAGGIVHGLSNSLSGIPVVGNALKYGGIGISDALHSVADASNANFSKAGNDTLSSFSNAIHGVNTIPVVGQYVLPGVASIWGGPLGYAAASGIQNGFENSRRGESAGQAIIGGAKNAGLSYVGSSVGSALGDYAGNSLSGTQLGNVLNETPANAAGNTFGADTVANFAPMGSTAGNILGSATIGQSLGSGAAQGLVNNATTFTPPPGAAPGFSPSEQPSLGIPQSLSQLSNLNPQQQTSNIASQGVYGGGNGPQETNYFLNQINRQLFDQNGNVQSNNNLAPIDMSYLNQLGISGSTPNSILQGISQYGT